MQPIIIIGSGRSGTNMLRDTLTSFPQFGTWPCDEINYIWRYGNAQHPNDELQPQHVTNKTKKYIQNTFQSIAKQQQTPYVVEKTCANSLRVPFVDTIFPKAKYIFITRDGRDVVASAMQRWSAKLDIPYILKKARYVPFADLPYYASRYLGNRVYRLFSNEERLAFWGPRFVGMEDALRNQSLAQVCALQWQACINKANQYLQTLPSDRVHSIKYENFVKNPVGQMQELGYFLGMEFANNQLQQATQTISTKSIGNWQKHLSDQDKREIEPILQETLIEYGYKLPSSIAEGSV